MADYNDMTTSTSWTALPEDVEDTIIYCDEGEIRFTAHTVPQGNTVGVPLRRGEAHIIKAGTVVHVRSFSATPATVVRTVA